MIYTKLCKITKRGGFVKQMLQNAIAVYVHIDYKKEIYVKYVQF